eukprot:6226048-Prorocentrum_lima.AAC.1
MELTVRLPGLCPPTQTMGSEPEWHILPNASKAPPAPGGHAATGAAASAAAAPGPNAAAAAPGAGGLD